MTKTQFLLNLQNGRRQWHQIWRGIDLFGTSSPRRPGELSLRDILYHVAWYEREMVNMMKTLLFWLSLVGFTRGGAQCPHQDRRTDYFIAPGLEGGRASLY